MYGLLDLLCTEHFVQAEPRVLLTCRRLYLAFTSRLRWDVYMARLLRANERFIYDRCEPTAAYMTTWDGQILAFMARRTLYTRWDLSGPEPTFRLTISAGSAIYTKRDPFTSVKVKLRYLTTATTLGLSESDKIGKAIRRGEFSMSIIAPDGRRADAFYTGGTCLGSTYISEHLADFARYMMAFDLNLGKYIDIAAAF